MQKPPEISAGKLSHQRGTAGEQARQLRSAMRRLERAWPLGMVVMLLAIIGLWMAR